MTDSLSRRHFLHAAGAGAASVWIPRPVKGYGLPAHVRVTVGLPDENERFIEALARVLDR